MRTNVCTAVTLDTVFRIPYRNVYCDTTFFECSCTGWCRTVYIIFECRYRQCITFLSVYFALDVVYEIYYVLTVACCNFGIQTFVLCVFPAFRNVYFNDLFCTFIDSCPVLLNDIITLTSVSCFCCCFHQLDRTFFRNDVCQFKECRLQDGIDTSRTHACLDTDLNTINDVEFDVVLCDVCFYLTRQMFFQTFHIPWAVQQECTAVNQFLNHVVFTNIGRIVACYKVCFFDQVGRFDRFLTETQVRHGNTAGFL